MARNLFDKLRFISKKAFFTRSSSHKFTALERAEALFAENKYTETLNELEEIEMQKLDLVDHLDVILVKTHALINLGKLDDGLVTIKEGEQVLKTIEESKKDTSETIAQKQALLLKHKGFCYLRKGELDNAMINLEKSLVIREKIGLKLEIADSLHYIGTTHFYRGDLDIALETVKKSLAIKEEVGRDKDKTGIAYSLNNIGEIYRHKGEINNALHYYEESLTLLKELDNKYGIAGTMCNIGIIYGQKNNPDLANQYLKESLALFEEIGNLQYTAELLFHLVKVNLDISPETAQEYANNLKEIASKNDSPRINQQNRLAEGLLLKKSPRQRNKFRALEIFEEISTEEMVDHELTVIALQNQCELLLFEFKTLGEEERLVEIKELVRKLLKIAKEQQSHWLLAETHLLKSKLSLVELKLDEAKDHLNRAQLFAEEHGLQSLAMRISSEYDTLLEQQSEWDELSKRNAPMKERADLAQLDEHLMDQMIKKEYIEAPELPDDNPVQLFLLFKTGFSLFTKAFKLELGLDDTLVSGLMSAIFTFSEQVFSQTLERLKIGDYTLVIRPKPPLLICYAFEGQSYSAIKKVNKLVEMIENDSTLWEAIKSHVDRSQALSGEGKRVLEQRVDEIFT